MFFNYRHVRIISQYIKNFDKKNWYHKSDLQLSAMISALDIIAITEVLTRIIEIGNFYPKTSLLFWVAYYG